MINDVLVFDIVLGELVDIVVEVVMFVKVGFCFVCFKMVDVVGCVVFFGSCLVNF